MHVNKRKSVFISGSAYEYGSFGDDGKLFIRDLSKTLLKNGFTIVSGFGYGVGNYVLEGALEELYVEQQERMTDRLKVIPLPHQAAAFGGHSKKLSGRYDLPGGDGHFSFWQ